VIADVHLRRRLDGVRAASLGAVVHPRFRADPVHLLFSGPGQRRHQQLDQWCTLDDKGVYLLLTELVASLRPCGATCWSPANGRRKTWSVKGWAARIFQNEIDHLDGRLFTDCMVPRTLTSTSRTEQVVRPTYSNASPFRPNRPRKKKGIRRPTAQVPWLEPCLVERLIGSIRLECVDHLVVLSERRGDREC
jgi:hypothetical protein